MAGAYSRRLVFLITALLSAVVIIGAGASYAVMRNEITRMAGERTRQELQSTAAAFSTMFASSVIPASEQVFETPEVNSLIYGSVVTDQQLLTATPLVDRFQLANPLIDSISVYNSQRGTVYSTRYGLSKASDPRNADIMRILDRITDYRLYRFIPRVESGKQLLTVILGSRPFEGHTLLGGLIVNVSEQGIGTQLLGRRSGDGTRIAVLDSSGIILFDTSPGTFGADAGDYPLFSRVLSKPQQSGSFSDSASDAPSLVSYYREPLMGWTFVSSTSDELLYAGIARWRNEIILVFAVLLVLSVALGLSASRQVSKPLARLLTQAKSLQADLTVVGSSSSYRDDLSLISETMELLSRRLHDLSQDESREGRSLARAYARVLLDQALSDAETEQLRDALFDAASNETVVLVVVVDRLESRQTELGRSSVLALRGELAAQLVAVPGVRAAVEMDTGTVAAAIVYDTRGQSAPRPLEALQRAIAAISDRRKASFTAGLSDPIDDLDDLPAAYDAAAGAVRYRFRYGRGSVISQSQCARAEEPYVLPDTDLRRLGEQARLLNGAAVEETITRLLEDVRPFSYEDFVFLAQNLLHTLERVFAESGVMTPRELDEYRDYVFSARWIETTGDVRDLALRWCDRYYEHAHQHSDQRVPAFVADVKRVIEMELVNPNLSAKSVAARLKSSVNYVRATFKSATGDSVSNHITRLRIERCKELLGETSKPVKEIAEAAGFRNYNYFFTLFKKQTGRTPQEYQRQIATK